MRFATKLPMSVLCLLAAGAATASMGCAAGVQKQRVAVLHLGGPQQQAVEREVEALVGRDYEVVSTEEYRRVARELGAERIRGKDVAKVAKRLRLDGVLTGRFHRRGKKRVALKLKVRSPENGRIVDRYTVVVPKQTLAERHRDDLQVAVLALLDGLPQSSDWREEWRAGNRHAFASNKKKQRKKRLRRRMRDRKKELAVERTRAEHEQEAEEERERKQPRAAKDEPKVAKAERSAAKRASSQKHEVPARKSRSNDKYAALDAMPSKHVSATYDKRGQAIDEEVPPGL